MSRAGTGESKSPGVVCASRSGSQESQATEIRIQRGHDKQKRGSTEGASSSSSKAGSSKGHGHKSRFLTGRGSNGNTSPISPAPPPNYPTSVHQDTTSWMEQIQFKAQYHHFRTNNYASVVNSAYSIGKVSAAQRVVPKSTEQVDQTSELEAVPDTARASGSSSSGGGPKERERHSLCWNFPRVKLRKLFNAKSLDDILGRQSSSPQRKECQSVPTQQQKHHLDPPKPTLRPRSSSSQSHKTNPDLETVTSPGRLSASSSNIKIERREFHYDYPLTPQIISNCSSEDNCYLTSSSIPVPEKPSVLMDPMTHVTVTSAKSDNCISRVSPSAPCLRIPKPPHHSVSDIPGPSSTRPTSSPHFSIPIIIRHSPEPTKPKRRIHFVNNKVEPDTKGDGETRPKLVVASVSYLQRPVSPSCVQGPPKPKTYCYSDPSGTGMRSPAASGSRTPQALLSPTGILPPPAGFRDRTDESTKASVAMSRSPGVSVVSVSRGLAKAPGKGLFSSCCRSQSIPTQEDDQAFMDTQAKSKDRNAQARIGTVQSTASRKNQNEPIVPEQVGGRSYETGVRLELGSRLNRETGKIPDTDTSSTYRTTDPGERRDSMAGLKSPDYVKQSSLLLNSHSQNGSHRATELTSVDNVPTYVNVSRSVSGYTCLHYNGSEAVRNGHRTASSTSNGNGTVVNGSSKFPSTLPPDYSPYISPFRKPTMRYTTPPKTQNGEEGRSTSPCPPSLPKSAPPLSSPSLVLVGRTRLFERNQGDESPPVTTVNSNNGTPRIKSAFILQQIEKLYGNQEMASTGYCWKRSSEDSPPKVQSNGNERIIPIRVDMEFKGSSKPSKPLITERIVPIVLEDQDRKPKVYEGVAVRVTPGRHRLHDPTHPNNNSFTSELISHGDHGETSGQEDKDVVDDSGLRGPISPVFQLHQMGQQGGKVLESHSLDISQLEGSSAEDVEGVGDSSVPLLRKNSRNNNSSSGSQEITQTQVSPVSPAPAPAVESISSAQAQETKSSTTEPTMTNKENEFFTERNGDYFLAEVLREKNVILALIDKASVELDTMDPAAEEAGHIRTTIGKAKLLINKRFKQFEGLCNTNLEETKKGVSADEPFTTKNEDLAGFWDMVMIQVDQIHEMFGDTSKSSGSKPIPKRNVPLAPKKVGASDSSAPAPRSSTTSGVTKPKDSSSSARDEARRKLLAEKRRAMKKAQVPTEDPVSKEPDVQIFYP